MPAYSPGFRSRESECDRLDVPVEGEIPAWLSGTLVRNGPGRFEVGGERVAHWFDGLAMLRAFRFGDGEVTYSNRFLRTETFRTAVEEGELSSQFATSGSYLRRLKSFLTDPTDNANVHVARLGGEYVALTETPRRVRFDPADLSTRGDLRYRDDLTLHHVTAHLQYDRDRGETVGYGTEFGRRNRYHVYRVPDDRPERVPVASVEVDRPAYIHSFALTPTYAVLVEPPYVVNPLRFLLPGGGGFIDSYRWRPERGTRFRIFDRSSGELVADRSTAAFFFFHTANGFETDDEVVVDLAAYDDATIVDNLFMSAMDGDAESGSAGGGEGSPELDAADGTLARFRVPLDAGGGGGDVERESLYRGMELPRVAPAARGSAYRYAYGQATRREGGNGLAKVNVETGEALEWWEASVYAGEPIFVPRPDGDAEDRGVVLSLALDADAERSFLLVLDAETFEERARAPLPHVVPFGFHGEFFPDVTD
ncbi:carotenoid oxygenase family protein [Halorussus aquaticus]|uniref:Carotenoid oxygenase family protein n=1 Tax=Halorussus aquaticus TaxID=2953748 RepID=A0ABD5Q6K3_9EURY|nr:carotenoid oxygenase family protein [Halorussus aquaticus]